MPTTSDLERLKIRRDDAPKPSPFDSGAPPVRVAGGSRKGVWILVVVLAVAALAVIFALGARPPEVTTAPVEVTGGMSAGGVSAITANGYVVARTKASVAAKVAGRLA